MIQQTGEDRESKSLQGRAGQRGRRKNNNNQCGATEAKKGKRFKKELVRGRSRPMQLASGSVFSPIRGLGSNMAVKPAFKIITENVRVYLTYSKDTLS